MNARCPNFNGSWNSFGRLLQQEWALFTVQQILCIIKVTLTAPCSAPCTDALFTSPFVGFDTVSEVKQQATKTQF